MKFPPFPRLAAIYIPEPAFKIYADNLRISQGVLSDSFVFRGGVACADQIFFPGGRV